MPNILNQVSLSTNPVYHDQAKLMVMLIRDLLAVYEQQCSFELSDWFELPEYSRFHQGAYACGFVCGDLAPMENFQTYQENSSEYVKKAPWPEFRHYIHTLLRAERWAEGYSSPILDAVQSGALAIVADRLEKDQSFR